MGSELFPQSLEGHLTELCLQPFVGISASRDDGLRRVDQDVVVNEADPIFVAWQGKIGLDDACYGQFADARKPV